jgi:type VI secretion system protein ImpL
MYLIYLIRRLLRLTFSRTTLVFLGLLALCGFVWFAGPLFAFADVRPLESEQVRWNIIITIGALFLIWLLVRFWRRKNLNAKFLNQLTKIKRPLKENVEDPLGAREVEALQERFSQALNNIKNLRVSGGGFNRLSGRYIYELPWYIIVGAPGSGKTTALVNSGLNFPLEEKTGRAALKGIGGTRNCDWWITDEAVIIDTAGRYTTQDSNAEVDKIEWRGFLNLLKKYRPRQPINGIIFTLSTTDLLAFSREERDAHYSTLRTRLSELQESFGIELPVYIWVTKVDLLAGFSEFFDNYSADLRKQVWGFTFSYQERPQNIVKSFDHEWDLLQERLYLLQDAQLARETESRRLSAIYSLPQQLAGLQAIIREAIEAVFRESKQVARPLLRGVYLSSGTQEGTPFDRILTTLRRNFSSGSTSDVPAASNQGKSYFLYDFFLNLIFKETHLAGQNIRWEQKVKWLTYAGYTTAILALALAIGVWAVSYGNNKNYLAHVEKDTTELSNGVSSYSQDTGDLSSMIALLNATVHLGDTPTFPRKHPTLPYRYGLYQGGKVGVAVDTTYTQMLKDGLLPIVAKRLESQVEHPPVDSLEYLYDALKSYLMLYDAKHYDPEYLQRWVSVDARRYLLPDADTATLTQMDTHLAALFNKDRIVTSPFPINDQLVTNARKKLETLTTTQRVYSRLRARLESADNMPEFNLLDVAGPQAENVFTRRSKLPLNRGINGLFTYQGYWDVFDKEVGKVTTKMLDDETWVLGLPSKTVKTQMDELAHGKLVREVRMAYLRDYADIWDQYLSDIQLIPSNSLQTSIQRVRVLSAPDSPLRLFLKAVVKETTLLQENRNGDQRTMLDRAKQRLKNTKNEIERVVGPVTAGAIPLNQRLEHIVDDRFEPLRRLVGPPNSQQNQAPIDATLKMLDEYYGTLVATDAALRSGDTPPSQESAITLRAEAARLPQPVRGMLDQVTASSSSQTTSLMRASIGTNLNATVGDFCRRAIAGRYPLRRTATSDVAPEDFARLFAPGGLMDDFFNKNLASIVDTSNWTFKKNIDGSWAGGGGSLASFQKASVIRDVFFRDGGRTPSIRLEIKPIEMDPTILSMSLDVDGTVVRYNHGPQLAQSVTWPGPRGRNYVLLEITGQGLSDAGMKADGPWALYRFFDMLSISSAPASGKFLATATIRGKKIVFEVTTHSVQNPFRLRQLEEFSCPSQF